MKASALLSVLPILLLPAQALFTPSVETPTTGDAEASFQKPRSLDNEWRLFKQRFSKFYSTPTEEEYRRLIWEANHWRVLHHNLLASLDRLRSFRLAVNQFADMLPEEFAAKFLTMLNRPLSDDQSFLYRINLPAAAGGNQHQDPPPPVEVDWRTKGCVSPVKDQGLLQGCSPFQVVGSIEGQICAQFGPQRDWLSYQQVLDCANSTNSPEDVYAYLASNQGMLDWQTPCRGHSNSGNSCSFDPNCVGAIAKGSVNIPSGSESALELAVAASGPVTVEVDASHSTFQLYESGVYNEPKCTTYSLNHVMLVVGYGVTSAGEAYWVVKNSWGTGWGQQGYILMSRNRGNQCGIATAASYALAKPAQV